MESNNAMELLAKQYVHDACEVTHFKLIRNEQDLANEEGYFHPDMSHQIFGEKESIFGYKDLKIKILYGASSLEMYVNVTYSKELDEKEFEGVKADDVMKKLRTVLPEKFHLSVDQFSAVLLKEEAFRPFGDLINSYFINIKEKKRVFEIYKVTDTSTIGFQDYLIRMESFILWFIDAASFVDPDDDKWEFYLLYEKSTVCGITSYYFVGYATCYRFYCYPDKCRPRMSQMLVLPPFQKQGHCTKMIQCIYNEYCPLPDVFDVTAEDPSSNFQRVRDYVDCVNCCKLKEFHQSIIHKNFTKEMADAARKNYKINKRQSRRVYEILRLKATNVNDNAEFTKYRLMVKTRHHLPMKDNAKKKSVKLFAEMQPKVEDKYVILEKAFQDDLEQYSRVVERLSRS